MNPNTPESKTPEAIAKKIVESWWDSRAVIRGESFELCRAIATAIREARSNGGMGEVEVVPESELYKLSEKARENRLIPEDHCHYWSHGWREGYRAGVNNAAKPSMPSEDEIDQAARSIWREIIEEQAFKAGVAWLRERMSK